MTDYVVICEDGFIVDVMADTPEEALEMAKQECGGQDFSNAIVERADDCGDCDECGCPDGDDCDECGCGCDCDEEIEEEEYFESNEGKDDDEA